MLKTLLAVLLCGVSLAVATTGVADDGMPFRDGERVLFLGDSITNDGTYAAIIEFYLWQKYPDRDITVINLGLSSETVSGITEPVHPFPRPNVFYRLETALRISRPNWVVACYGMNDGIYRPVNDEIKDKFRGGIQQLVDRCEAFGARVILATPPFFDAQAPRAQKGMRDLKDKEPYGFRRVYEAYNDETL
ncbi:MAG: GDSL-type esterase/lipase family protein, partial [Planctomycetota bacterium]